MGLRVLPVTPNAKTPAINDWPNQATDDVDAISAWWREKPYNVGVACGKYGDRYLIAIDVDRKNGKDGEKSLASLESSLPPTLSERTAKNGYHLFYWSQVPIGNRVAVWPGVDVRGVGGFVVAHSSAIDGKTYEFTNALPIADLPAWLSEKLQSKPMEARRLSVVPNVSQDTAYARAVRYLADLDVAVAGEQHGLVYEAACVLKDFGLSADRIVGLMYTQFKCSPEISLFDFDYLVADAFKYGKNTPGVDSPEASFDVLPIVEEPKHPLAKINEEYFFCVVGAHSRIFRETTDRRGAFALKPYVVEAFHHENAPFEIEHHGKMVAATKLWMRWSGRRAYESIQFLPGIQAPPSVYNTFRGFPVAPLDPSSASEEARRGFAQFIAHCRDNVCAGNQTDFEYLMGFFAHMIQRPQEKPGVAIVLQGLKGTGKSFFVETISDLVRGYEATVSDRRYLVGQFNSMQDNKLLYVLSEVSWGGNKQDEGILKEFITGSQRQIERKGIEAELKEGFERVMIVGNDDWLVPASWDERRFAVYQVSDARRGDRAFFGEMRKGLAAGGLGLLMAHLQAVDLSAFDVRKAPRTKGLEAQIERTLDGFEAWWQECLQKGYVEGNVLGDETWPDKVVKSELFDAYRRSQVGIRNYRRENDIQIGMRLRAILPSLKTGKCNEVGQRKNCYVFPPVAQARAEFDTALDLNSDWPLLDDEASGPDGLDPAVESVGSVEDLL